MYFWGHSSAGRALHWQCRGQGFEPPWLHQSACAVGENVPVQGVKKRKRLIWELSWHYPKIYEQKMPEILKPLVVAVPYLEGDKTHFLIRIWPS